MWEKFKNRQYKNLKFRRQIFIEEKEIRFIRVTNEEINTDINLLFHRIEAAIIDSSFENQPAP